jgi:SAM-dependent methyltransferase
MDQTRQRYLDSYWERQFCLIEEMIAPYKREDGVLLDIGCGYGRNAARFARGISRYIGLNIDEEELDAARQNNPDPSFEFRIGDAMDMKVIEDGSVDIALLIFVLEHIEFPDRLFAELSRVLRPGGAVFFLAPNLLNPTSLIIRVLSPAARFRIKKVLTGREEPPDYPIYYRCNTVGQMDRMAARFGLERDRVDLFSSLGYLFRFPGFYRLHRFSDRVSNLAGLRGFRQFIFATYRKL